MVHPQSIVHSLVELNDGAQLAHLGLPDMRVPISYALHYPDRADVTVPRLDLAEAGKLEFEPPDPDTFACLRLAREAGRAGGTAPCALNAADEVAVGRIPRGPARVHGDRRGDRGRAGPARATASEPLRGALRVRPRGARARGAVRRAGGGHAVSWILAFAGFSFLIIAHEAGHMVAAKAVGMRVERFFLFFPPKLWSVKRGETEYGIGSIPLGGFVKITGMNPDEELEPEVAPRAYYHQPVWKRIVVIGAGPLVNLVIAFVILYFLAFQALDPDVSRVDQVQNGSPAAEVLQPGDELIAVDGVRGNQIELREQLATHTCAGEQTQGCEAEEPAVIVLVRDGEEITVTATPTYDEEAGRPLLGFTYAQEPLDPGLLGAATWSADRMWEVTSQTVSIVGRIFDAEQRKQISGVVGSYEVTRQSIEFDTRQALFVLALISLSLAVINLFPFLPLDGGHIFWSLVEKVRGKPVPFRVMERASVIGFALVLMLFVIGLTNDIDRLSGEGFDVR